MSFNPTDPADLFGGMWERIEGMFLMAACDEYPVNSTGGYKTGYVDITDITWGSSTKYGLYNKNAGGENVQFVNGVARSGGYSVKIMPPYLAVYMWRRIA